MQSKRFWGSDHVLIFKVKGNYSAHCNARMPKRLPKHSFRKGWITVPCKWWRQITYTSVHTFRTYPVLGSKLLPWTAGRRHSVANLKSWALDINSLVERPLQELPGGFGSSLESLHHRTETSTWRAAIASGQGGIWHVSLPVKQVGQNFTSHMETDTIRSN